MIKGENDDHYLKDMILVLGLAIVFTFSELSLTILSVYRIIKA